jgi:multisubunit Na+/H+ antiporter MnhB subunit
VSAPRVNPALAAGAALAVLPVVAGAGFALLRLPAEAPGLAPQVAESIGRAGASNPVTAVLLNFRGYDTMLEVTVLFLAVVGAHALSPVRPAPSGALQLAPSPVLIGFVRVLAPFIVLVAGYMLWVGGHKPGGAFQAGAVLASLGVVLHLCRLALPGWYAGAVKRWAMALGLVVFVGAGAGFMLLGLNFLEYPVKPAKWWILAIEAASTLSIAAILTDLFVAGQLLPTRGIPEASPEVRP